MTVSDNSIKEPKQRERVTYKEIEVASVYKCTDTHTQNVLHVCTLINKVFGSLGPAAVLGK